MECLPDMGENIYLAVVLPDSHTYSENVAKTFTRNMQRSITSHGMINSGENSRYFVTMDYVLLSKDIVTGPPARISQEVQFNFVLADAIEQKVFSSLACSARGIGTNEEKAILSALKKIRWDDPAFDKFFSEGKAGIITYYTQRGPEIIVEARKLESMKRFNEALSLLTSVPSQCPNYRECMRMAINVYQNKVDYEAAEPLSKARSVWAVNPTKDGADQILDILKDVPVYSKHEQEILAFIEEIKERLKEIANQEWQLELEKLRLERAKEQAKLYKKSARSSGGGGLFSSLADKWSEQPTWKKVLIGAGVGLGAATIGAGAIASSLLSRSAFHFVKFF
jgi:hypothetical protein